MIFTTVATGASIIGTKLLSTSEEEELRDNFFKFFGDNMSSIPDSWRRTADKTEEPGRWTRGGVLFGDGTVLPWGCDGDGDDLAFRRFFGDGDGVAG